LKAWTIGKQTHENPNTTAREALLLYIVATTQVVSAILIVEQGEEGHALKVQ
jgi:hypothetical protein